MNTLRLTLLLSVLSVVGVTYGQTGDDYAMTWFTIDGGGGRSSGEGYVLTGTIGQSDAGYLQGGDRELLGGFWAGEREYPIAVAKCTVAAGSKANSDKISFSGLMDAPGATADDLNNAGVIEVSINSEDMVGPCVQTFPINSKTYKVKSGKYSYSGTDKGVKKSLKYNVKTRKFTFSASKVGLSGLGCPLTVEIKIGDYIGTAQLGENIVNGAKKPIPINLMMGVKNVLRVEKPYDKLQVKRGKKKPNTDQLSVKGGFAVKDTGVSMANRVSEDIVITLGTQTFTIPANSFKPKKTGFTCSKVKLLGGGIASASFNFNKCSFTLTIKNITAGSGAASFNVQFAGFSEGVQVILP